MKDSKSKYLVGPQELLHYPCLVYKSWNDVWILELKVSKWLMLLLFAYLKYFKGLRNDRIQEYIDREKVFNGNQKYIEREKVF